MNGEKRNACRLLVEELEGKRPLGRPRCRWMVNIMMDLLHTIIRDLHPLPSLLTKIMSRRIWRRRGYQKYQDMGG
jgi:hypothetical protein